jgi:hypothetical protein
MADACRAICGQLIAHCQMQAHVQEWIGLPLLRTEVALQDFRMFQCRVVFRMQLDDVRNLQLQRLQGQCCASPLPGIAVHLAQLIA